LQEGGVPVSEGLRRIEQTYNREARFQALLRMGKTERQAKQMLDHEMMFVPKDPQSATGFKELPIEWLIPRVVPTKMITLIAGRPKQGKSLMTVWAAAQVTRQGGTVLFSNHEDLLQEMVVPRLRWAGAEMKRIKLQTEPFILPEQTNWLERKIKQLGVKLLVMDAANQHLSVPIGADQAVRQALTPLKMVLERTGCAAMFVSHLNSNTRGDPLASIGGSRAGIVAAARCIWIFGRDPKNPQMGRIAAPAGVNFGADDEGIEFVIEVDPNSQMGTGAKGGRMSVARLSVVSTHTKVSAKQVISYRGGAGQQGSDDGTNATRVAVAAEWLTGVLKDGPKKAAEIEAEGKKINLSWRTIRRASDEIKAEKKPIRQQGGGTGGYWVWDLNPKHPIRKMREKAEAEAAAKVQPQAEAKEESVEDELQKLIDDQTADDIGDTEGR
jgi:hypothetical protein